jgi:hypothetical protein
VGNKLYIENGYTIGKLKVIGSAGFKEIVVKKKIYLWECVCECGRKVVVKTEDLRNGFKKSCGCLRSSRGGILNNPRTIRLYKIWRQMKQRCFNPKHIGYKNYGAKGIKVCDRWLDFNLFLHDMGDTYKEDLSIERADNTKGYSLENCSWIEKKYQNSNTSRVVKITFRGETMNIKQWSEKLGIPYWTLFSRLRKNGWSVERALTSK